jgi:hypothetical protein
VAKRATCSGLLRLALASDEPRTLLAAHLQHAVTVPLRPLRQRHMSLQSVLPAGTLGACDQALCHRPVLDGGHRRQLGSELLRHWVLLENSACGRLLDRCWSTVVRQM